MRYRDGLVIGKFYPLHKGHQHVIQIALDACDRVHLVTTYRPTETIPADVRERWIRELYPTAHYVLLPPDTPYYPHETSGEAAFYDRWRQLLVGHCGRVPDAIFTSEDYGDACAAHWGSTHVCVDKARSLFPISGTECRRNPYAAWDYLDPVVRAHFVKTVCVYGPESCGKTTLAERLARHYCTAWQHEFARPYLGDRHCEYADMQPIAEGHLADRRAFLRRANRLLFIDTDTFTTMVFSEKYYGTYPPELDRIAALPGNQNDLYLLLDTDVPWVPDTSRDLGAPEVRREMFARLREKLDRYGKPYVVIDGTWEERFAKAVAEIDARFADVLG